MPERSFELRGVPEAMRMIRAVSDFLQDPQPMQDTVDDVKDLITEKTAKGQDFMGHPFAKYSAAYAKKKHKTKVDLRDTGEMLDSIATKVANRERGSVYIGGGRAQIAEYHNEGDATRARLPQRRFMDINDSQLSKITKKNYDDKLMVILGRR